MSVELPAFDGTLPAWRMLAVAGIRRGISAGDMPWRSDELFAPSAATGGNNSFVIPPLFARLAASVSCHRDPAKWDALYRVLWRIAHGEPELLTVVTDPMVHRLVQMHRNVKRAAHKMKAFVRFRAVDDAYIAWFEPAHDVVQRTAPFFVRRFPSMRWAIFTPDRCAHWDRELLTFSPGLSREHAPCEDELEELWRTYYANIFNPARLNGRAMRAEMPRRYWGNLPEARIIDELRDNAPARVRQMMTQVASMPERLPEELEATSPPPPIVTSWDVVHDPGVAVARERDRRVAWPSWCRTGNVDFGVAGWTDPTLLARDVFYPRGAESAEARLQYYASRFPFVEVDATYYTLPSRSTAAAWAARTPEGFSFDIKAHALMTGHPADIKRLPDWIRRAMPKRVDGAPHIYGHELPTELMDEVWTRFRSALDPLRTSGKLGAIMLQYPRWFEPTRASAAALRRAKERLGDDLATVELRNRAWMEGRLAARTLALLEELGLSYVIVDAPPGTQSSMPPTVGVTDKRLAVFRLHGRRVATWEAKNDVVTERYRYLYDEHELRAWMPAIRETAFNVARVHITFNNNHANYATTNAAELFDFMSR